MSGNHRYRAYVTLYRDGRKKETVSRIVTARTLHEAGILANGIAHRLVFDAGMLAHEEYTCKVRVTTL